MVVVVVFTVVMSGVLASSLAAEARGPGEVNIPGNGSNSVSGIPRSTNPVDTSAAGNYSVTFKESGLPSGTAWSITIGSQTVSSVTVQIDFSLGDGSYDYQVNTVAGYHTTASTGTFTVAGAPRTFSLKFSVTRYSITFVETGLPRGTVWNVTLTPSTGSPISLNSPAATIAFSEPNGSYSYSIAPIAGYHVTSGSMAGAVTVAGANPTPITEGWSSLSFHFTVRLSTIDDVAIGAAVFWVVVGVLLLLRRRRKRKSSPGPAASAPGLSGIPSPPPGALVEPESSAPASPPTLNEGPTAPSPQASDRGSGER